MVRQLVELSPCRDGDGLRALQAVVRPEVTWLRDWVELENKRRSASIDVCNRSPDWRHLGWSFVLQELIIFGTPMEG